MDERASWNLRDVKFAKGGALQNWAVLVIQDNNRDEFHGTTDAELRGTVAGFVKMCKTSGMIVGPAEPHYVAAALPPKDYQDPTRAKSISAIRTVLTTSLKQKPSFILVILSNGDKHIYVSPLPS